MTIEVTLGERWDDFISREVAAGRYASGDEVVVAALEALAERERRLAALRAHIVEGSEQAMRGEFVDCSLEDIIAELDAEEPPREADH